MFTDWRPSPPSYSILVEMENEQNAAEHREKANELRGKVEESWQRSDTDGFLSQWALGISAQREDRLAAIAEAGGKAEFTVALDADGNLVPMKTVDTKYGSRRVTLDENGRFDKWYSFSTGPRSNFAKDGLREARVMHPATAILSGSGTGLSGNVWVATKPICVGCGDFLDAIGRPCRNGHTTDFELVEYDDDEGETA